MAGACPAPAPGDPLVEGLLSSTDCHLQLVVRSGYGALFEGGGGFSSVLTVLLTVYVALIGYRLLLGRGQLNVSDLALTAVKIGAIVAFATQWGTYEAVVYRLLFDGPQEVADALLRSLSVGGGGAHGDVFAGLQHAFDDLTAFSPASPPGALAPGAAVGAPAALAVNPPSAAGLPSALAPGAGLLSRSGFDSLLLLGAAVILLLSSLGVLLASKIALSLLLALGPVFIAMLLFDSTRGLFEGWLRASLGFAFTPVAVTLLLSLSLGLLEPSLAQLEAMRDSGAYSPGVAFAILILVVVFAGVTFALLFATGIIAARFKLPQVSAPRTARADTTSQASIDAAQPERAARVAYAAAAQERRDAMLFTRTESDEAVGGAGSDRRTVFSPAGTGGRSATTDLGARLGQEPRRRTQPRDARAGSRRGRGAEA